LTALASTGKNQFDKITGRMPFHW